jgi:hypothetical protein
MIGVADRNAPAFSGTVALTAESSTSIKAAWSAAFTDAVGITEGRVYYSTTTPANTTASGVTAWKAAATTYYVDVSPLSSLGAAGSATVTALVEGTTYNVYLCVKDATGNELNVATSPASIATPASVVVAGYAPDPSSNEWWYNTANVVICGYSNNSYTNDIGYLFKNAVFVSMGDFPYTPTTDLLVSGSYNSDPNSVVAQDPGTGIWDLRGPRSSDTVARRQIAINLLAAKHVVWRMADIYLNAVDLGTGTVWVNEGSSTNSFTVPSGVYDAATQSMNFANTGPAEWYAVPQNPISYTSDYTVVCNCKLTKNGWINSDNDITEQKFGLDRAL